MDFDTYKILELRDDGPDELINHIPESVVMRTISHPNLFSVPVASDRKVEAAAPQQRRWSISSLFWSFRLPSERSVYALMKSAYQCEANRSEVRKSITDDDTDSNTLANTRS